MKLIKVEYIEESSKAIFFNVTFETKSFFGKIKTEIKRAFLEKWDNWDKKGGWHYGNNFRWSDNTGYSNFDDAVREEMILQYEKTCNIIKN